MGCVGKNESFIESFSTRWYFQGCQRVSYLKAPRGRPSRAAEGLFGIVTEHLSPSRLAALQAEPVSIAEVSAGMAALRPHLGWGGQGLRLVPVGLVTAAKDTPQQHCLQMHVVSRAIPSPACFKLDEHLKTVAWIEKRKNSILLNANM